MHIDQLLALWTQPQARSGLLLVASILVAGFVHLLAQPFLRKLVSRTYNEIDDIIVDVIPTPLAISVLLMGVWYALQPLGWSDAVLKACSATMMTVAVALWTRVASRVSREFLGFLATHQDRFAMVEPRTLPLFDIMARALLFGGAAYFLLLAWDIDVTAWLASAGVLGVAVGFASKDTLSNLFAGLFIVADAPYKLGDFLVVDDSTRGRVTQIGLRSTRLLTRDDVEVIIPNSLMAGGRITNASGGPSQYQRVHCAVEVGYDSDLDVVRKVLLDMARGLPELLQDVEGARPYVRFQGFMDSGIKVDVRGWVATPQQAGRAVDAMVVGIWRALRNAKIEIPFPQRDVRLLSPAPPGRYGESSKR